MPAWGWQGGHNGLCDSLGWQGGDFALPASFLILNEIMPPAPRPGYPRPPQVSWPPRHRRVVTDDVMWPGTEPRRGARFSLRPVTSNSYHRPVSAAATLSLGTLSSFVICPGPGFLVFLRVAAPNNDYTDNGHPLSKYHITA